VTWRIREAFYNYHVSAAGVTYAPIQASTATPSMDPNARKHVWRLKRFGESRLARRDMIGDAGVRVLSPFFRPDADRVAQRRQPGDLPDYPAKRIRPLLLAR
jgi:hypothetical protein